MLPLSKQLSVLSGHVWSRTLAGQRAQRIEMLLLHEFHSRKFILPDKMTFKVCVVGGLAVYSQCLAVLGSPSQPQIYSAGQDDVQGANPPGGWVYISACRWA